jgi:hypothetical protein
MYALVVPLDTKSTGIKMSPDFKKRVACRRADRGVRGVDNIEADWVYKSANVALCQERGTYHSTTDGLL